MPGYMYGADNLVTTLLLIISVIISVGASIYVKKSYLKYKNIANKKTITGFEVARKILDVNGLSNVHVVEVKGELTDHYEPRRKTVRLSTNIFHGDSIAAASVAAHEVGHSIQDKNGYMYMKIRSFLVPIVNLCSKLGYFAIIIGLIFEMLNLAYIGMFLLITILVFQLITLPVEFDASKKALAELNKLGI